MLSFARPWWLLALIIVPLLLWYQFKIQKPHKLRLPFTRLSLLEQIQGENAGFFELTKLEYELY